MARDTLNFSFLPEKIELENLTGYFWAHYCLNERKKWLHKIDFFIHLKFPLFKKVKIFVLGHTEFEFYNAKKIRVGCSPLFSLQSR